MGEKREAHGVAHGLEREAVGGVAERQEALCPLLPRSHSLDVGEQVPLEPGAPLADAPEVAVEERRLRVRHDAHQTVGRALESHVPHKAARAADVVHTEV